MSIDALDLANAAKALALLAEVRELGIDVTPYGSVAVFVGEAEVRMYLSFDQDSGDYTLNTP